MSGAWAGGAVYDPASGIWNSTSRLRAAQRSLATASSLPDGSVALAGGLNSRDAVLGAAEIYHPQR